MMNNEQHKPAAAPDVALDKQTAANGKPQPIIGRLMDQISALPVLWGLNEPGALLRNSDVLRVLAAAGREQASAAAPQVVADEHELPPLPEMASAADLAHVMQTPEDWDADYRSTWQKLQVEAHNRRQWRKYALELRAAIASNSYSNSSNNCAAAPVQAQEPVAWKFVMMGEVCFQSDRPIEGDTKYPISNIVALYRAPVQPVAVSDGWRDAALESAAQAVADRAGESEKIAVIGAFDAIRSLKANRHALPESSVHRAAPAALGDAKDAGRYLELRDGDNAGDLLNFMLAHAKIPAEILDAKIDAAIAARKLENKGATA